MKLIKLLITLITITACSVEVTPPEETKIDLEEKKDSIFPEEGNKDPNYGNKDSISPEEGNEDSNFENWEEAQAVEDSSFEPDCGDSYEAKIVYESDNQKFYACFNGEDKVAEEPEWDDSMLENCGYLLKVEGDFLYLKSSFQEDQVQSRFKMHWMPLSGNVFLPDPSGTTICTVILWDREQLSYISNQGIQRHYTLTFEQ